jgi:hypothetical protein
LARLQVEGVPFDVLDDVFLQDFAFEALKRAFQAFAIVNLNFSQRNLPRFVIAIPKKRSPIQNSSLWRKVFARRRTEYRIGSAGRSQSKRNAA